MGRKRRPIKQIRPTFAFVVDGKSEIWYLQMLKRNERKLPINIKPELPQRKSVEEQYELVKKLSEGEYSKVFWIIDLDTLIKESNETSKSKKSSLQKLIQLRKKLQKSYKNVVVIINNPCLEFWFLLHFEKTSRCFDTCKKAENELKKHLEHYDKTKEYFTKQGDDIYLKLKPYLETAINNSSNLGKFDSEEMRKAICEMFLFFESDEIKKYYEKK